MISVKSQCDPRTAQSGINGDAHLEKEQREEELRMLHAEHDPFNDPFNCTYEK